MVHIGKAGHKYHRASCRNLPKDAQQVPLRLAKARGYASCRTCRPVGLLNLGTAITARTVQNVIGRKDHST
jgi:hypothetical protein